MPNIENTWSAIEAWFANNLPEVVTDLNPPASDQTIQNFEMAIGQALPEDFKALYRIRNGQRFDKVSGLFFHQIFISLETALERWASWHDLLRDDPDLNTNGGYTSSPENAITKTYINNGWIPFTYDWAGNHIGIDLNPGVSGVRRQVINFGRDEDKKFVIAHSLAEFLVWVLAQLNTNVAFSSDDEVRQYGYRQLFLKTPENRHLLEAIRVMFSQHHPA